MVLVCGMESARQPVCHLFSKKAHRTACHSPHVARGMISKELAVADMRMEPARQPAGKQCTIAHQCLFWHRPSSRPAHQPTWGSRKHLLGAGVDAVHPPEVGEHGHPSQGAHSVHQQQGASALAHLAQALRSRTSSHLGQCVAAAYTSEYLTMDGCTP